MLVDHAAKLETSDDLDALWQGAVAALRTVGIHHAIYLSVDAHFQALFMRSTLTGLYDGFSPERDPFLIHSCDGYTLLHVGAAFIDHHPYINDTERALIERASDQGFHAGIGVPMRLKGAERFGGFILGNDMDGPSFLTKFEPRKADIRLFCMIVHRRLEELAMTTQTLSLERSALVASALPAAFDDLTPRETEVVTLIAQGRSRAQTAHLCNLSIHTVSDYAKQAYRKLGITNRAEAATLMSGAQARAGR